MSEKNKDCEYYTEDCNGNCDSCPSNQNAGCSHDCASCGKDCGDRIEKAIPTNDTRIKKIVAVLSGKGGVGKSMVSSLLAVELARAGYKVGILDSDITGPSIPKIFGATDPLYGDEGGIIPNETKLGIKAVSVNMMLGEEETPVLWRGPILGGIVKQFYSEVHWGDLDYLLIDMPPGTSDVAISIFQLIPVDEVVMVTTPSKLVSMVVAKAINMAMQVNVPIIGLVENMAYVKCDRCGNEIMIYHDDDTEHVAEKYELDIVAKLPIDPKLANMADEGKIEDYEGDLLKGLVKKVTG
ncbi:MAG: Mrp/NBP35 family ATP-binding protein [Erysipelotrichaceae bacterium]|nr:Mrp/NBP35 family ATP-binding protein [Erysipelotrichaceae bacterium]